MRVRFGPALLFEIRDNVLPPGLRRLLFLDSRQIVPLPPVHRIDPFRQP
jgi:hypothetical protein